MKVVIISSSDTGGAGIAALRLHKALLKSGVQSSFLCLDKKTRVENVYAYHKPFYVKVIEHLPIPYKQNKYKKYYRDLGKTYECFSFPEAIYDISDHPLIKEADVINLHWVGNMLNYQSFFRKVKKPIIWTLHDMNPFLGFAHYMSDKLPHVEYNFLESKVNKLKLDALNQHQHLTIVNLCKWMKSYSSKSDVFKNRRHEIIPNSIDTSIFRTYEVLNLRNKYDIPSDIPVFLFVSQAIENGRKGFDLLLNAISHVHKKCIFLVVGKQFTFESDSNIKFLGAIHDEKKMAEIYSLADAFILPSREDNLPNTMVESLCCGTPVITFSNGGMKDSIVNFKNGILISDISSNSLANGINYFIDNIDSFNRAEISEQACVCYSPQNQSKAYIDLFNSVLNNE